MKFKCCMLIQTEWVSGKTGIGAGSQSKSRGGAVESCLQLQKVQKAKLHDQLGKEAPGSLGAEVPKSTKKAGGEEKHIW